MGPWQQYFGCDMTTLDGSKSRSALRIVMALSLLQTLLISILILIFIPVPEDTGHSTMIPATSSASIVDSVAVPPASDFSVNPEDHQAIEELLQKAIREELRSYVVTDGPAEQLVATTANESIDGVERQYQLDTILRQMTYFRSVGAISDIEMETLQAQIERLGDADYQRMMSQLITAMNDGEIEGRLR